MSRARPIVTRLTAPGVSALATIRVEGPGALDLVEQLFHRRGGKPLSVTGTAVAVGRWQSPDGEELVVGVLSPDACEIHCHGGSVAGEAIMTSLAELGAERVEWRQWLARHEPDTIALEARIALAQTTTETCARILLDQHEGALRRAVENISQRLSDGETQQALANLERLLATAHAGSHLVAPFRVVLVGPPNAGKSSLLNAILGYQRAIVFDEPGTTRDILSADTAIGGWPMRISDTAGARVAEEPLEQAGIAQARRAATSADLLLVCVAKDQVNSVTDAEMVGPAGTSIRVGTKCDMPGNWPARVDVATSATRGEGIDELLHMIKEFACCDLPPAGEGVVFTHRQRALVREAIGCLQRGGIERAGEALSRIVADSAAELA